MVLEQLYSKFKDKWIVELLFDDLLMWTNWIRDKRLEAPADLVVLGSGESTSNLLVLVMVGHILMLPSAVLSSAQTTWQPGSPTITSAQRKP